MIHSRFILFCDSNLCHLDVNIMVLGGWEIHRGFEVVTSDF